MPVQTKVAMTGGTFRQSSKYPNGVTVAFSTGGSLGAGAQRTATVAWKGARLGHVVLATPRAAITAAGLILPYGPFVSANDVITFTIQNPTAGGLTPVDIVYDIALL